MDFKTHLSKYLSINEINKLIESLNERRNYSLVLNTKKIDEAHFLNQYPSVIKHPFLPNCFYYDNDTYSFGKSYLFDNGLFYIMDASSMVVSYLLNPNKNDLILDMCAAPGGKTIYTLLNYDIKIVANDVSYSRALTLSSNIEKLGLEDIIVTCSNLSKSIPSLNNTFDKIILDAPCSGSAMFRKNIEMENDWSYEKVIKCSNIQKILIDNAINFLKDEGELIYSTCSFSYEENEEIIKYILNKRDDVELINLPSIIGEYRDKKMPETIHLFPHLFRGEGQFIAKLRKKGNALVNKSISSISNNKINPNWLSFIKKYNLNFKYYFNNGKFLYGYNFDLKLDKEIKIIRKGINLGEIKKINNELVIIPSFNLAHYLTSSSISLNKDDFKKYIHGEELVNKEISLKDDYYIVSYKNLNLGFVKKSGHKLKNLYPKGLRF